MTKTTKSKKNMTERTDFDESKTINVSEFVKSQRGSKIKSKPRIRDGSGKYTTKVRKALRSSLTLWKWVLVLGGVAYILNLYANWYLSNEIIRQDAFNLQVQLPYRIEERKPREILRPLATEILTTEVGDYSDLTETEKIILEAFGKEDYKVARAIAFCESGLNEEAINWESRDLGLMQINLPIWEQEILTEFGYSRSDLLTATYNVEVAKYIWDRADGKVDGNGNFSPWVALQSTCLRGEL